jgi:hypothetical protein
LVRGRATQKKKKKNGKKMKGMNQQEHIIKEGGQKRSGEVQWGTTPT